MSTLRINNIEAKSVPASPTIDEKVKITNSSGDVLIHIDGKTSGITTIGINTTAGNIKFDANSNVVVTGIITATKFVGEIEPTNLTVSGKVSVGGSVTAATFYGDGSNLTGISGVSVANQADNRLITATGTTDALNGEAGLTYDGSALIVRGSDAVTGSGGTKTISLRGGDANNEFVNLSFDTGAGGPLAVISAKADATGVYPNTSGSLTFNTQVAGGVFERLRITSDGRIGMHDSSPNDYELDIMKRSTATDANLRLYNNATGSSNDTILRLHIAGTSASNYIYFGDGDDSNVGQIRYHHSSDSMRFNTNASERLRIDSSGRVMIGNTDAASLYASGNNLVVGDGGASNQGMTIYTGNAQQGILAFADGTSGGAQQYAGYLIYDHNTDHMLFATGSTTRLQIKDDGQVLLTGNNTGNHMSGFGSNVGGLTIDDVGNQHTALEVLHGSNKAYLVASSNNSVYLSSYGTGNLIFEHTGAGGTRERFRIDSSGRMGIGYNAPRRTLEVNSTHDTTANTITPVLRLSTGTGYSGSNTGSGLEFGTTSTSYPTWIKGRIGAVYNGSSNYGGHLVFETNSGSAAESSNSEKMRISDKGLITNTTQSTHPQGAGTFEIKGVINQYSQGSGSGLIFDCDFGRLTGYGDDTGVGNGTNLSACLSHSTTDWTSNNSNTPITVNGGTFQYRVGFGGYFDCIDNGARASVGAGSGVPAMGDKLNTAAMTIETWVWYDGDGREVIVSRFGSGFPNQFNMLCDPNGQFHYNNTGVGAGGGNVSGEHFPDKTWHHHLWQYESGVNRWYINGAFANSRSAGSSLAVSSGTGFAIGSRADRTEDWRGKIAIVRIYNRALSATEIKNHFELERGRFGV